MDKNLLTLIISHQIFRLQITINDSPRVQIINCFNNTPDNEMRLTLVEWTLILNHCPDFTSKTSVQQQIYKLTVPKIAIFANFCQEIGDGDVHDNVKLVTL